MFEQKSFGRYLLFSTSQDEMLYLLFFTEKLNVT